MCLFTFFTTVLPFNGTHTYLPSPKKGRFCLAHKCRDKNVILLNNWWLGKQYHTVDVNHLRKQKLEPFRLCWHTLYVAFTVRSVCQKKPAICLQENVSVVSKTMVRKTKHLKQWEWKKESPVRLGSSGWGWGKAGRRGTPVLGLKTDVLTNQPAAAFGKVTRQLWVALTQMCSVGNIVFYNLLDLKKKKKKEILCCCSCLLSCVGQAVEPC